MMKLIAVILAVLFSATAALAQGTVLQGGPWAPGHAPMYTGQGSGQAVVQDSGPAGGGGTGYGMSEGLYVARGTGTPPYVAQGTGPFGTNWCDYDAPITNPTGYHFLCLSPNAQGGGLLSYGAGGAAAQLPFQLDLNGILYQFPFSTSGVIGPATSVIGDVAIWNNTVGTLVKDLPPLQIFGTESANCVFSGPTTGSAAFPSCRLLIGADLPTIYSKDILAASGRPWCDPLGKGAAGNDTLNVDDAAFVACLTQLSTLSPTTGGEIRVSPSHYCLNTGAFSAALAASTVTIDVVGSGTSSWLDVCGADVDGLHFSAAFSVLKNIRMTGAAFTTNPAHNAVTVASSMTVDNNLIEGGYYAVATQPGASDWNIHDNIAIRNPYGPAVIEVAASGGYLKRNKVDAAGGGNVAPTAWSANTTVTTGQTVTTNGPNGVPYVIIYRSGGTSGSIAPVVAIYGTTFADGTATALLEAPVGAYALEVNGALAIAEQDDFSGNYLYGVHVTGAGAQFYSVNDDATLNLSGSLLVDNGYASVLGGIWGSCLASPCKVINITTSALGATIGSATSIAGGTTGIEYDAGTFLQVTGARFSGLTNGINIGTANLSNIPIVGNVFGWNASAVTNAIVFTNGTSDYVDIWGNVFQLTTTPFTGTITGTHNAIERNGVVSLVSVALSTPLGIASGGTAGATAAAARTSLAVAGLGDNNTFIGTNTFQSQIIPAYGTPTIASGACGTTTNGTLAADSTNQSGLLQIASASTTVCTISFSATLAAAPLACVLFPANAAAAATGTTVARVSSITTGGWVLTGSALANANYYYHCL